MDELNAQTAAPRRTKKRNRKSDGADGGPLVPTMTGQNAALKETPAPGDGVNLQHPKAAHVRILDRERALVETTRKSYALCGFASSTRDLIPIDSDEWEIWGMNQLYRHIKRADRWFDIHWNWDQELVPGTDHHGWIRASGMPVYMLQTHQQFPTSVKFPIAELLETFGADYFTSTVAHMMALAIWEIDHRVAARLAQEPARTALEGLRRARALYAEHKIGLFGIDLIVGEEYFWQKPCAEFWIGAAAIGRGIEVYVPPSSALCKQRFRYGYETEPATIIKPAELNKHKASLSAEREKLLKQVYMLDGACQTDEYWNELIELRLRGGDIKV